MLDRQLEAFHGGERLADMTLGLASVCERVAALLAQEAQGELAGESGPLADAILGVLSLRRRLWTRLALAEAAAAPADDAPPPPRAPRAGLLR
jgi:hypothetical protein